jgi:hypothetical protein
MIWKQKEEIGTKSFPQYYGHYAPMSIKLQGTPHSSWCMEQMQYRHLSYILYQLAGNEANQDEVRELESNLLEEKLNKALANMQKYQESLKWYYNKSVVLCQLEIRDLMVKKDIRTKDNHKFSSH